MSGAHTPADRARVRAARKLLNVAHQFGRPAAYGNGWVVPCPTCREKTLVCTVDAAAARIALRCQTGCDEDIVIRDANMSHLALRLDPADAEAMLAPDPIHLNGNGAHSATDGDNDDEFVPLAIDSPEFARFARFARASASQEKNGVAFPVEVLPEPLPRFVREVMRVVNVPADYAAVPLLAALATVIGRRVRLALNDEWHERAVFWFALVGEPGDGKSPAQRAALKAFKATHKRRQERYNALEGERQLRYEEWEAAPRKDRGPRPPDVERRHLYTTDATMEKVGHLLLLNNGVLYHRDELTGFVKAMDQYRGRGDDREKWLGFFSLEGQQIDRLGRGSFYVDEPHVCVLGGVQPDNLPKLAGEAQHDGFVDRLLWCWPVIGPREEFDEGRISESVRDAVTDLIETLGRPDCGSDELPAFYVPGYTAEERYDLLRFDSAARTLWRVWYRHNERLRHRHRGTLRHVYVKFAYHAARLALVLHCVQHPARPRQGAALVITAHTLAAALRLTEYFRTHTNKVLARFAAMGSGPRTDGDRVYDVLADSPGEWLTTREIGRELHNNGRNLSAHLEALAREGKVEGSRGGAGRRGRPGMRWRAVMDIDAQNAQNAQIPECLDVDALLREAIDEWERGGQVVPAQPAEATDDDTEAEF